MKKRREEGGGQEWLNTYADMITLVLTFFCTTIQYFNVNISKLEEIAAACSASWELNRPMTWRIAAGSEISQYQ